MSSLDLAWFARPRSAPARRRSGFRAGMLALVGFGAVYTAVRLNRTAAIDLALTLRLQGGRLPFVSGLMRAVSWPGFPPQSRVIPPLIVAAFWSRGRRLEAACESAAWGTALLATVVKATIRRPRPVPPEVQVVLAPLGGTSFPSGHVLTYVGVYGFLAYSLNSLIDAPMPRRMAVASLLALIALVGPSRIHQGHHWPTDVTASYLLGLAYLEGIVAIHDRLKRGGVA